MSRLAQSHQDKQAATVPQLETPNRSQQCNKIDE